MNGPSPVSSNKGDTRALAVQELAEEFRRLAAEARKMRNVDEFANQFWHGEIIAFEKAAQMLEERLDGS